MKKYFAVPALAMLVAACSEPTSAPMAVASPRGVIVSGVADVYDFEGISAAGGSSNLVGPLSIAATPLGTNHFLGQFNPGSATLNVNGGSTIDLAFDLYIIGTWDGAGLKKFAADVWSIRTSCDGGATSAQLYATTFSNQRNEAQNFPNQYLADGSGVLNPALTNAFAVDALGYSKTTTHVKGGAGNAADATYHLVFDNISNPCGAGNTVTFIFGSNLQQSLLDESWGIDNLSVVAE